MKWAWKSETQHSPPPPPPPRPCVSEHTYCFTEAVSAGCTLRLVKHILTDRAIQVLTNRFWIQKISENI